MLKKCMILALSLMMILCAVSAAAETAEMTVLMSNAAFTIQGKIPEGITITPVLKTNLNMIAMMTSGDGNPTITLSIAYNEEYAEVERFNDVDEETVEEIRESFRENVDDPVFEDTESAYGTRLLKVTAEGFADIYSIYKGYEFELVMTPAEGEELTDEDIAMLVQFISDIEFVPAE